jgi:hypothetical protein
MTTDYNPVNYSPVIVHGHVTLTQFPGYDLPIQLREIAFDSLIELLEKEKEIDELIVIRPEETAKVNE